MPPPLPPLGERVESPEIVTRLNQLVQMNQQLLCQQAELKERLESLPSVRLWRLCVGVGNVVCSLFSYQIPEVEGQQVVSFSSRALEGISSFRNREAAPHRIRSWAIEVAYLAVVPFALFESALRYLVLRYTESPLQGSHLKSSLFAIRWAAWSLVWNLHVGPIGTTEAAARLRICGTTAVRAL